MMPTFEVEETQGTRVDEMNEGVDEASLFIEYYADPLCSWSWAFRQDLRDAAYYGIGRFPTLVLHRSDGSGIVLVGYRPYDVLVEAVDYLVPGLCQKPVDEGPQEHTVLSYVTHLATCNYAGTC